MSQAPARSTYSLFHFIALSGDEGARCVEALEADGKEELVRLNSLALEHLRRREVREGVDFLAAISERIDSLSELPEHRRHVLRGCWYHGALAYYYYCIGDFGRATWELDTSYEALVSAIATAPFLLPLVEHLLDFCMQRSRVARVRDGWGEMRRHLDFLRQLIESRLSLFILDDGQPVFLSSLVAYYRLLPLDDSEKNFVDQQLLNTEGRLRNLDLSTISLCHQPGFVIPYT